MSQLVELGGVWAWVSDELRPGGTNSGIIADSDGLTIVDAQLTPAQGGALFDAASTLGPPIRRLALTSSHMPFVGGSAAFVLPAVYGTAQISADLDMEPNIEGCGRLYPADAPELGGFLEPRLEDDPAEALPDLPS